MTPDMAAVLADLAQRAIAQAPPVASRPAASSHLGAGCLRVHEDVLPDWHAYTAAVRALAFRSVPIGAALFHGLASCDDPRLADWIRAHYPQALPTLSFYRQSPAGQVEPNFIHTDRDLGDWTAIFYLTVDPPPEDGTTFWRDRETGATASTATTEAQFRAEWPTWRDGDRWEPWHTVDAAPNRLVLFPAPLFHSRAIVDNYGTAGTDARLIQVVFGTGTLEDER
jgi:hypothetical protein